MHDVVDILDINAVVILDINAVVIIDINAVVVLVNTVNSFKENEKNQEG